MSDYKPAGSVRQTQFSVDPIFTNRWSPRAMTGAQIDAPTLMTLFEAARWAPSSGNGQPWRFVYAQRATETWPAFLDLLVPGNRLWCANASALVVIASRDTAEHNGKPAPTHSFDTGAAWMSLSLQGSLLGLVVHGMAGFDWVRAKELIGLPDGFSVEAMCAIGYPAAPETLPEALREREKPSDRKPMSQWLFEGKYVDPSL